MEIMNEEKLQEDITYIKTSLSRIEEHLRTLNNKVADNKQCIGENDKSIKRLERWVWMGLGALALLSLLINFL